MRARDAVEFRAGVGVRDGGRHQVREITDARLRVARQRFKRADDGRAPETATDDDRHSHPGANAQ